MAYLAARLSSAVRQPWDGVVHGPGPSARAVPGRAYPVDISTAWRPSASAENVYEGRDRATGERKWSATATDLVFGAHSQLRALAEVYASDDAQEKFVRDFVAAWNKIMNLDRYDLVAQGRNGRAPPRSATECVTSTAAASAGDS